MKRFLIICIVLLVVLTLAQVIYYKLNPKETNISSSNNLEEDIEEEENKLYIIGMSALYENDYNPKISFTDLQRKFYDFIFVDIPEIYININNKSIEETKQYYEQNTEKIKNMGIYNEDDFVMIAHQINNVFDKNEIVNLYNYNVDTNTISKSQNGLITFKVNLIYDNEKQIQVLYTISEEIENVKISSATDLDEVFKQYTGKVTKQEVLNKIDTFISSIKDIRLNSTLKTENERRQYFDLNKEELENIGITSQDDYVGIAIQINAMRWRESDLQFERYEINSGSIKNEEDYISFELNIYYNYDSKLHLKVSISDVVPNIKISSYENE